jgi:hypothetical protein
MTEEEHLAPIPGNGNQLTLNYLGAFLALNIPQENDIPPELQQYVPFLKKILGKVHPDDRASVRRTSERAQQFRQTMENLLGVTPTALHYGLYKDIYLSEAEDLPENLKSPGNIALLIGCLTVESAQSFIETVRQISPNLTPVILDLEGYYTVEYAQQKEGVCFVFGDAKKLPFAAGTVALIHTNYLFTELDTETDVPQILHEIVRVIHPQGIITPIEHTIIPNFD